MPQMDAEKDLVTLLKSISPSLIDGEFVFCSFENACYGDYSGFTPIAAVQEGEGLTLVIPKFKADERQLSYEAVFKCIRLNVHSSLEAIGLTAAVSRKLSDHGICANVIAGYFHDHIFVSSEHAHKSISALEELSG